MRHDGLNRFLDPKPGVSINTLAYEYPAGTDVPNHAHGCDQLIYAIQGVMEVTSDGLWIIPPSFGLWIPARRFHGIHMSGAVSMRSLYIRPSIAGSMPREDCAVLHVTPLLRELIVEAVRIGQLRTRNRYQSALRDLLIRNLADASPMPTHIRLPVEARALKVAQAILEDPSRAVPLAALCDRAGASVRTIERQFRKETGVDFEFWRRQVRLIRAIEALAAGCSVKEAAHRVGYMQPSAFVEMFKRTFGTTPKAWVQGLAARE
ncbi:MAG TPA: helix-turn-helix transcriptional regulator [Bryobacteraceae bacterium]